MSFLCLKGIKAFHSGHFFGFLFSHKGFHLYVKLCLNLYAFSPVNLLYFSLILRPSQGLKEGKWDFLHILEFNFMKYKIPVFCETAIETQIYRTVFWTLWERVRVGWCGRMALKHVYYHMWNESPVQVGCMRQGVWGWCTGMTQRDGMGREVGGGSGLGTRVHPWRIHVDVWQNQHNIVK